MQWLQWLKWDEKNSRICFFENIFFWELENVVLTNALEKKLQTPFSGCWSTKKSWHHVSLNGSCHFPGNFFDTSNDMNDIEAYSSFKWWLHLACEMSKLSKFEKMKSPFSGHRLTKNLDHQKTDGPLFSKTNFWQADFFIRDEKLMDPFNKKN